MSGFACSSSSPLVRSPLHHLGEKLGFEGDTVVIHSLVHQPELNAVPDIQFVRPCLMLFDGAMGCTIGILVGYLGVGQKAESAGMCLGQGSEEASVAHGTLPGPRRGEFNFKPAGPDLFWSV